MRSALFFYSPNFFHLLRGIVTVQVNPRAVCLAFLLKEGGFAEGKDGRSKPRWIKNARVWWADLTGSPLRGEDALSV